MPTRHAEVDNLVKFIRARRGWDSSTGNPLKVVADIDLKISRKVDGITKIIDKKSTITDKTKNTLISKLGDVKAVLDDLIVYIDATTLDASDKAIIKDTAIDIHALRDLGLLQGSIGQIRSNKDFMKKIGGILSDTQELLTPKIEAYYARFKGGARGGASRKQEGGGKESKSDKFYKSLLVLILLKNAETIKPKEFLKRLKNTIADAGQEDLVMDLLRKIIDKSLTIKESDGYTFTPVNLDQTELKGLEEAFKENFRGIVLEGGSINVEPPEEFRDALGHGPYFLTPGEEDILFGLDEEVELSAEEKNALSGGIPMTAILAMYLVCMVGLDGMVGSVEDSFGLDE